MESNYLCFFANAANSAGTSCNSMELWACNGVKCRPETTLGMNGTSDSWVSLPKCPPHGPSQKSGIAETISVSIQSAGGSDGIAPDVQWRV